MNRSWGKRVSTLLVSAILLSLIPFGGIAASSPLQSLVNPFYLSYTPNIPQTSSVSTTPLESLIPNKFTNSTDTLASKLNSLDGHEQDTVSKATYEVKSEDLNRVSTGTHNDMKSKDLNSVHIAKEQIEKRTRNSKVFLNSDETMTVQTATYSLNYFDGQAWQDIDTTIRSDDTDPNYSHSMLANNFKVKLNNKGNKQSVTFSVYDQSVTYRTEGMNKVTGVVYGNTITYPNAWQSTDLQYQVQNDQLKMELHLADNKAPKSFEFELKTKEVKHRVNADGSIDFVNKDGKVNFKIPQMWVMDASSDVKRYDRLKVDVKQKGNKTVIKMTLDDKGLQWPIVIDPTTSIVYYASTIISDTIPTTMKAGTTYSVSVTVRNDGTDIWSEGAYYRLGAMGDSDPFAGGRQIIQNGQLVAQGQTYTFNFTMTAPTTTGSYTTDWQMVQDSVAWFGATLTKQVSVVNTLPVRVATIMSDSIPTTMETGKTYPVTITVRNDGNDTWSESGLYRLGAVGDSDPFAGGRQYIPNGQTIITGQTYTFSFNMVAPVTTGSYVTDWQMVQDAVSWFGGILTKTMIVVPSPPRASTILSDTIPTTMEIGKSYSVSVTVRNDGSNTWTESSMYRLGAMADSDPFAGGRQYIPNGQLVAQGLTYTFNFNMTAPSTMGTYTTDWQMVQDAVTWFGATLSKQVTVVDPNKTSSFVYDRSDHLQTVKLYSGHRIDYQYDLNGNLLRKYKNISLLINGSFEIESTNWHLSPVMSISNAVSKEGSNSLHFSSTSPIAGIASDSGLIQVMPNSKYTMSGWILNNLSSGNFYISRQEFDVNNNMVLDAGGAGAVRTSGKGQWEYGKRQMAPTL